MRRCLLPATFVLASTVAAQQWTALDGPRYLDRAAAFDTHRLRLVIFSGDGETWEYDGDQLLHRPRLTGAVAPPPRSRAQMAYDPLRKHVLMFGGDVNNSALADTWTFDGARWTQLVSQPSPLQRAHGAITFDGARGRVLLYGGTNLVSGFHTDTWEHDGAQWTQRSPATVPGPNPVMAFDSGRGVAVMVTYPLGLPGQLNSTWEWNGTNWLLRTSAGAVPGVDGQRSLAYDPLRQRTVMTGGQNGGDQVWEWDGTAWSLRATVVDPHRNWAASWFDPVAGKVVVAGGQDSVGQSTSGRTGAFEWDGVAMTPRRSDHRPPSRLNHAWFDDPARQQWILFGGVRQTVFGDTWRWNGNSWTRLSPPNQPLARGSAATTFDWVRGEPLLFGGSAPGQTFGDLWAWTGTDWVQRGTGSVAPSARHSAGLCFDLTRGAVVLFGGSGSAGPLDDTWEWNGTAWTNRPTVFQPSPRGGAAMTCDFTRGRVVLFGGSPTPGFWLNDTWEWNGTQWSAIQPTVEPPVRVQPSLNYDLARSHSVLTGVVPVQPPTFELWSYNGVTWTSIATAPSTTLNGPCRIDTVRDRLLVASPVLFEWSLRPSSVAEYGAGCGTPAPVLLARARPRIGEPAFGVELGVGAGQLVGFVFAETQANVPVGNGCTLLFGQPAISVLGIAGGTGVASLSMSIPDTGVLHGYVLFAQAGVLDPASPGGFRLTQGLRFGFGD